jgi:Na+/phosphate symporter
VRQTANFHTLVMVMGVLVHLPVYRLLLGLLSRVIRSSRPVRPGSFLDQTLLRTPEDALVATILELKRVASIALESLAGVEAIAGGSGRRLSHLVRLNEAAIDEVKLSVQEYLRRLSRGYLSQRQALMVQALNRDMVELERIGDHIDKLSSLSRGRMRDLPDGFDADTRSKQAQLFAMVRSVLTAVEAALDPEQDDYDEVSWQILERRRNYLRLDAPIKSSVNQRVIHHELPPVVGLLFSEFASGMQRIVRHCGVIAGEMRQPFFRIKRSKLGQRVGSKKKNKGMKFSDT